MYLLISIPTSVMRLMAWLMPLCLVEISSKQTVNRVFRQLLDGLTESQYPFDHNAIIAQTNNFPFFNKCFLPLFVVLFSQQHQPWKVPSSLASVTLWETSALNQTEMFSCRTSLWWKVLSCLGTCFAFLLWSAFNALIHSQFHIKLKKMYRLPLMV